MFPIFRWQLNSSCVQSILRTVSTQVQALVPTTDVLPINRATFSRSFVWMECTYLPIAIPSCHQLEPCNCKREMILQSSYTIETNVNHECAINGMIIVYETYQSLCVLSIYTSDPLGALDRGYKIPSLKTKPPHVHTKWQLDWGIVAMTRAETKHTANSQKKKHLNKDSRPFEK